MIEFRKETKVARLHDPRRSFELVEIESEVRYDPLTSASARICHFTLGGLPPADLQPIVQMSREPCPFCPERIEKVTPRFPADVLNNLCRRCGDATLLPNLFPYDDYSAVAVLCAEHFLPMREMPQQPIIDGLKLARDFTEHAGKHMQGKTNYGLVGWNYMPPSGASQVHPHMQVVVSTNPGNALARRLDAEDTYRQRTGRIYARDQLEAEAAAGRSIGTLGAASWFVPFAPSGLLGDCAAVFPERATLADLSDTDIADFAAGLVRILNGFATRGLWSFNLSFFPAARGTGYQSHWLSANLLPRFYPHPQLHNSDVSYLHLHMEERVSMLYPEEVAAMLRESFKLR
ncbi:MAG: hypothetical protein PHQ05_02200 [Sterolibacterium sp.]|nr:hypothetical protein [Sterolibacterium sp.]